MSTKIFLTRMNERSSRYDLNYYFDRVRYQRIPQRVQLGMALTPAGMDDVVVLHLALTCICQKNCRC